MGRERRRERRRESSFCSVKRERERQRERESESDTMASGALKRLVPLLDRVLVSRVEPLKKSVGGVILPDSAVSKINEGTVVAVGPGARATDGSVIPMSVKEGDKVLLPEYGGTKVTVDDKEFTLFRDSELVTREGVRSPDGSWRGILVGSGGRPRTRRERHM